MGLDSVEILMGWEEAFGIRIPDDEAFVIRTPRMAIELIAKKLGALDQPQQTCMTLRAFHRLRSAFVSVTSIERRSFRPEARLKDLVQKDQWDAIRSSCGIASLPKPGWLSPRTVRDLTRWAVTHPKELKRAGEPWTKAEVRNIVRAVVAEQLGLEEFGDDDDFIKDLRVD